MLLNHCPLSLAHPARYSLSLSVPLLGSYVFMPKDEAQRRGDVSRVCWSELLSDREFQ
jgi:hypothetical protein